MTLAARDDECSHITLRVKCESAAQLRGVCRNVICLNAGEAFRDWVDEGS
jgi:hypothetical protein